MMIVRCASLIALACAAAAAPRAAAQAPLRAAPVQEYRAPEPTPLRLPTAVAAARDGRLFVVDGVNDRIVAFAPDGGLAEEIRRVGEESLRAPLGAKLDAAGRLWIADSGNHRVLVRAADGALEGVITPDAGGTRADITDVVPTPDGRLAWLVDNDGHRVIRYDLAAQRFDAFGKLGESRGELHYPYRAALNPAGELFVTDVINGRVQPFDAAGQALPGIGAYGVELGNLYRPCGIALDAAGRVWVSDSVTGAVQVFEPGGLLVDALRDDSGAVLKFDAPAGLDFDAAGNLYVVELGANRVRKLALKVAASAPVRPAPAARAIRQPQAAVCTACHVEWMQPLADGQATDLMAVPKNEPTQPHVSRPEVCRSCHDGSLVDSRRAVWVEHGHQSHTKPPPEMRIPEKLPLHEGLLTCRTCHSAHSRGSGDTTFREAVFLRVDRQVGELCIGCHQDHTGGPERGNHPAMGEPRAGARPDLVFALQEEPARDLSCLSCHEAHAAADAKLLVSAAGSNDLCTKCHQPGEHAAGTGLRMTHPLDAVLSPVQQSALRSADRHFAADGKLLCISCHAPHGAFGGRALLAEEPANGQACVRCHSEQSAVLGTLHDLRPVAPHYQHPAGSPIRTAGPCAACHATHALLPEQMNAGIDAAGHCITCHQPAGVARGRPLAAHNHPAEKCRDCHDPHQAQFGQFLPARAEEVCCSCHADKLTLTGGPHDATIDRGPQAAFNPATDRCLVCHRPHADNAGNRYRVAPLNLAARLAGAEADARAVVQRDAPCLACHTGADGFGGGNQITLLHPRRTEMHDTANSENLACAHCHNPHAGPQTPAPLLRLAAGESAEKLCLNCHTDQHMLPLTAHTEEHLTSAGFDARACGPCHSVHGWPDDHDVDLLWPKGLLQPVSMAPVDGLLSVADTHCAGCHGESGVAPRPAIATHPDVVFLNVFGAQSVGLPLYGPAGQPAPDGHMTCRTCHAPHGRELQAGDAVERLLPQLPVTRLQLLRAFSMPNICTTCHGADALRRYLYFHDPARRGGPL